MEIICKNAQQEFIYKKLFFPTIEPVKKGNLCSFCNGKETEYSIEKRNLDYPKWVIVIIDPSQINFFNLGSNTFVTNGSTIYYLLSHFIEANTNLLNWINNTDKFACHKIDKNIIGEKEKFIEKKPLVLFYNLMTYNHVMSLENKTPPVQNQNNQNLMNQNNTTNMNLNNINPQQSNLQNFYPNNLSPNSLNNFPQNLLKNIDENLYLLLINSNLNQFYYELHNLT